MAAPIKHARGEVNSADATLPLTGLSNVVAYACRHSYARGIGIMVIHTAISPAGEPFRPGLPLMPACARVPAVPSRQNLGPYTVRKNYLARRSAPSGGRSGSARKTTQYLVDRFLRGLSAIGQERVVRRRPGIANDINKQCTAACLTSHGRGHISAPPRWGAGSRRKPRRSLTTRTATSQAILAAEFFRAGAALLPLCPCIRFAPMPDLGGPETATRKPEVDADH